MMNVFLKMRGWQLFLLFIGPYSVSLLSAIVEWSSPSIYVVLTVVSAVVCIGSAIAWLGTLGVYLTGKTVKTGGPIPRLFYFCVSYTSAYFALFLAFFVWVATGSPDPKLFLLFFPLHILTAIAFLYMLHFISKKMVLVPRAKKAGFRKPIGVLLLLGMYPIGVWFIQPVVNKMYENK
jgi:hypothetical protein